MNKYFEKFLTGFLVSAGFVVAVFLGLVFADFYNDNNRPKKPPVTETTNTDFVDVAIVNQSSDQGLLSFRLAISNNGEYLLTNFTYGVRFELDGLLVNACENHYYNKVLSPKSKIELNLSCGNTKMDINAVKLFKLVPYIPKVEYEI